MAKWDGNPIGQWVEANGGSAAKRRLCGDSDSSLRWQTVHELALGNTAPTVTTAAKLERNSGGELSRWEVLRWYAERAEAEQGAA